MTELFTQFAATYSLEETVSAMLSQLPKEKWAGHYDLYLWEGSWYFPAVIESTLLAQSNFQARDDDIILTSSPKCGTTWLKALVSTIMHHGRQDDDDDKEKEKEEDDEDPLVKMNPHSIVKSLECSVYVFGRTPDLSGPTPRIFHSHLPYDALPDSIKNSKCKIVYIARNPKDAFVSLYHYMNSIGTPDDHGLHQMDQVFDDFCKGVHYFGPYHEHVLEYWSQSVHNAKKIHFIKYEELRSEPKEHVKKLAEFLGKPFRSDEQVEQVLWKCSLERLKNLEVNINGSFGSAVRYSSFFRLGVVGDWKNSFTDEMRQRLDQITRSKLEGSGLYL